MATQTCFDSFLSNIEPSSSTVSYISSIQSNLRNYLKNHKDYKKVHVDTFLSGSYAKHTSIRPVSGDKKRDVDIIVVTSYSADTNSSDVLTELKDVLAQKNEYSNAEIQHHSVSIEMSNISVDVVPVIANENDDQLYYIGDSDLGTWTLTDPKGHKTWSTEINKLNHNKYKPLVKILKWWRRENCPQNIKYPKGITLEKIIADNLADSSLCTEDFLIGTMQNIVSTYKEDYCDKHIIPVIADPSEKITDNNLLSDYPVDDFTAFITNISKHLDMLNSDGTSNDTWRTILGTQFPRSSEAKNPLSQLNYELCTTATHRQQPIWPIRRGGAAFISLEVSDPRGSIIGYSNNGSPLEKDCSLHFRVMTGIRPPYKVMWQIVNTGEEARNAGCLRGNFDGSNDGSGGRYETTSYAGSHSVQCFIIKNGICVATSREFIINIM